MFQSNKPEMAGPAAHVVPPMALIGAARLDGPSISLVAAPTMPIPGLAAIHLPAIRLKPAIPAPLLSESLFLLALCILLRGVAAKARQRLS